MEGGVEDLVVADHRPRGEPTAAVTTTGSQHPRIQALDVRWSERRELDGSEGRDEVRADRATIGDVRLRSDT